MTGLLKISINFFGRALSNLIKKSFNSGELSTSQKQTALKIIEKKGRETVT